MCRHAEKFGPQLKMLQDIRRLNEQHNVISSFKLLANVTAELDLHLLKAVLQTASEPKVRRNPWEHLALPCTFNAPHAILHAPHVTHLPVSCHAWAHLATHPTALPTQARLRLAVEWNRVDVVRSQELNSRPPILHLVTVY